MIGETLGQYKVVEEIGRGGMGTVYRAKQISLDRDIALKVMLPHQALDPVNLTRFKREGAVIAQIAHPNITQVIDIGEDKGMHFIAMEFVEGRTISDIIKTEGQLSFRDSVYICIQVASALGAIHEKGLVHRDVKPSNIIVGKERFSKLGDFGIAILADRSSEDNLTLPQAVVGTPYYMSPEQARSRDKLDGASDIYSLGVVLYEMLAGEHPFGDATPTEAISSVLNEPLPPIRRYCGNIPDALETLLGRCLSKDRAQRFSDGKKLAEALEKILLHLDMSSMDEGNDVDEYKSRVTGTNFFYVDEDQETKEKQKAGAKAVLVEMAAQIQDLNVKKRRQLGKLYECSMSARAKYKTNEKLLLELKERLKYHESKVQEYRRNTQDMISEGRSADADSSAENEASHENLVLDYKHQLEELRKTVEEKRLEYDNLKNRHSNKADELALLDVEARRKGKLIPSIIENPILSKRARILKYCTFAILLCLVLFGVRGVSMKIATNSPREGLVLHYSFDKEKEIIEGEIADKSNIGNAASVVGAMEYVEDGRGPGNGSVKTDGDSFLNSGVRPSSEGAFHELTVAVWVKPSQRSGTQHIVGRTAGSTTYQTPGTFGIAMDVSKNLVPYFHFNDGSDRRLYFTKALAIGEWNHVAVTLNSKGQASGYINAKPHLYASGCSSIPPLPNAFFRICKWADGPYEHYYRGGVDDVAVWQRALSSSEIKQLYKTTGGREGKPVAVGTLPTRGNASPQPLVWLKCDSVDDGVVVDCSGNNHHAVSSGISDRHLVPMGSKNNCLRFEKGFLRIRSTPELQLGSKPHTLCLWFKPDVVEGLTQGLITKWEGGNDKEYGFMINSSGSIAAHMEVNASEQAVVSTSPIAAGEWYHLAVAFDPEGIRDLSKVPLKMYLNGKQIETEGRFTKLPNDSDGEIQIGHFYPAAYTRYFHGLIDDVRIYSCTLAPKEIADLWSSPPGEGMGIKTLTDLSQTKTITSIPQVGTKTTFLEIEAENYTSATVKGEHFWKKVEEELPVHLVSYPGRNKVFDGAKIEETAPVLEYDVHFQNAGTYYLWARGKGKSGGSTITPGFNGTRLTPASDYFGYFPPRFSWMCTTRGPERIMERAIIKVSESGKHTINFWMRDDSFRFDKFLITSDPGYVPEETADNSAKND